MFTILIEIVDKNEEERTIFVEKNFFRLEEKIAKKVRKNRNKSKKSLFENQTKPQRRGNNFCLYH